MAIDYLATMHTFNPFNRWVVAFSIEVEPGVWKYRAVEPEHWPGYWWWECACRDLGK